MCGLSLWQRSYIYSISLDSLIHISIEYLADLSFCMFLELFSNIGIMFWYGFIVFIRFVLGRFILSLALI